MSSIFVSLCSFGHDPELKNTVKTINKNCSGKNKINIGLAYTAKNFDQMQDIKQYMNKYSNIQVNLYSKKDIDRVGEARRIAAEMFDGEDYFLQCDSHTTFSENWDEKIINLYNEAETKYKSSQFILTAYLPKYLVEKNGRVLFDDEYALYSEYDEYYFITDPSIHPWDSFPSWLCEKNYSNDFIISKKINAQMVFFKNNLHNQYLKSIIYDYFFYDEEFIISIELFNMGIDFITPCLPIPFAHMYIDSQNEYSGKRDTILYSRSDLIKIKLGIKKYLNEKANRVKIEKYLEFANINGRVKFN